MSGIKGKTIKPSGHSLVTVLARREGSPIKLKRLPRKAARAAKANIKVFIKRNNDSGVEQDQRVPYSCSRIPKLYKSASTSVQISKSITPNQNLSRVSTRKGRKEQQTIVYTSSTQKITSTASQLFEQKDFKQLYYKLLNCQFCDQQFQDIKSSVNHCHNVHKFIRCFKCFRMVMEGSYYDHLKKHFDESGTIYCFVETCKFSTTNEGRFNNHIQCHLTDAASTTNIYGEPNVLNSSNNNKPIIDLIQVEKTQELHLPSSSNNQIDKKHLVEENNSVYTSAGLVQLKTSAAELLKKERYDLLCIKLKSCPICKKQYDLARDAIIHCKRYHGLQRCYICFKAVSCTIYLEHYRNHSNKDGNIPCFFKTCHHQFNWKSFHLLNPHVGKHLAKEATKASDAI